MREFSIGFIISLLSLTSLYGFDCDAFNKNQNHSLGNHPISANSYTYFKNQALRLNWLEPFEDLLTANLDQAKFSWFERGKINICDNCLDRHLPEKSKKIALLWHGEGEKEVRSYTYQQLYDEVIGFSKGLLNLGLQKGDKVVLYLPVVPEAVISMLACQRLGFTHSIVFSGLSSEALSQRIVDSQAKLVITSNEAIRGDKIIPLKPMVDEALDLIETESASVSNVVVVQRTSKEFSLKEGRDQTWEKVIEHAQHLDAPEPEQLDSEHPSFILYTSGTTGHPKGLVHSTGGYLSHVHTTFGEVFSPKPEDVFWSTADVGWITGHSYSVYGPLSHGLTTVLFEGIPTFPTPDRFWKIIEKFNVNIFYTAPTVIRSLQRFGEEIPSGYKMDSLRLLGSVGETISPDTWKWYFKNVGKERCPIVDTWWQTETGGIMMAPKPSLSDFKPGCAQRPLPYIEVEVVDADGKAVEKGQSGYLVIQTPWPGMARTINGNHERYQQTYWSKFPGMYFTGDGAYKDQDGDIWIRGRIDDEVNVSGHRIGTAEVEGAIAAHPHVIECAIVPVPHAIKGETLYGFVVLKEGVEGSPKLKTEILNVINKKIGPIAKPDYLQFCKELPKTRSGKVMRRLLKNLANHVEDFGDLSTLNNPLIIEGLKNGILKI